MGDDGWVVGRGSGSCEGVRGEEGGGGERWVWSGEFTPFCQHVRKRCL